MADESCHNSGNGSGTRMALTPDRCGSGWVLTEHFEMTNGEEWAMISDGNFWVIQNWQLMLIKMMVMVKKRRIFWDSCHDSRQQIRAYEPKLLQECLRSGGKREDNKVGPLKTYIALSKPIKT